MRLEKINDNQIRCTLNHTDLSDRHMNISELAYGSDKARSLFREMLAKASRELDFNAEDIPLMIEAIPLSEDSIMLLITKVDEPEELDTRFSKFAPAEGEESSLFDPDDFDVPVLYQRADEIIDEFTRLSEEPENPEGFLTDGLANIDQMRIYRFQDIDSICAPARVLCGCYDGPNSLYKDAGQKCYYLVLHKGDHSPETFNKVCNILSEYSDPQKHSAGTEAYYQEHLETLIAEHAIQSLRCI